MYRLFFLALITISLSYCGGDSTTNSNTNTANTAAPNTAAAQAAPVKKNYEASHEAPYCKLWVVKAPLGTKNPEDYKGRWFDLKTDGTCETGQYQNVLSSGYWSIGKENNIIQFQFEKGQMIASNYEIQGAGGGGRILFKGNVPGNPVGMQLMLEPESERPSK